MAFRKLHPPAGSRPGTLAIPPTAAASRIRVMDYDASHVDEFETADVEGLKQYVDTEAVTWIDVQGLGDEKLLRAIGDAFAFHPLLLEDVVNAPQRPKVEMYDDQLLIVTRMARLADDGVDREQVSFCLGKRYLITFQERYGDVFDPVRARIRVGKGPIRNSGPDYLAYALLDVCVDAYYPVIEHLGDVLEDLETAVLEDPQPQMLKEIFKNKREMLDLRRAIWPQRDVYNTIIRDESEFVTPTTRIYFRDVYDHCVQIIDVLETHREVAGGLLDVYMSSVSNRMNEVMKVLTIMASIFIPVTFVAGVYGMNFEDMPELHKPWAYPLALSVMGVIAVTMLVVFWRKGWLGSSSPKKTDD